ncbi:uncharacterized protein LY79DRAFT_214330 [Colletotrichum navitas]|uniref:Uncharacterized protein n=1 Tax=Colletotrichum navitas TaxID=681940 RepID=A0AAD8PYZ0_9PEZI|nr:uncharacterized protein LY79DRAFT_214330 [Colletotrichum navitas]KAK1590585.1 hypothetical protein LY79DRAFT_214330 [Colletotrichum navitas]
MKWSVFDTLSQCPPATGKFHVRPFLPILNHSFASNWRLSAPFFLPSPQPFTLLLSAVLARVIITHPPPSPVHIVETGEGHSPSLNISRLSAVDLPLQRLFAAIRDLHTFLPVVAVANPHPHLLGFSTSAQRTSCRLPHVPGRKLKHLTPAAIVALPAVCDRHHLRYRCEQPFCSSLHPASPATPADAGHCCSILLFIDVRCHWMTARACSAPPGSTTRGGTTGHLKRSNSSPDREAA